MVGVMTDLVFADAVGLSVAVARAWDCEAPAVEAGSIGAAEQTALALMIVPLFDAIRAEWRVAIADALGALPDGQLWVRSLQRALGAGEQLIAMREDRLEEDASEGTAAVELEKLFAAPSVRRTLTAAARRAAMGIACRRAGAPVRSPHRSHRTQPLCRPRGRAHTEQEPRVSARVAADGRVEGPRGCPSLVGNWDR